MRSLTMQGLVAYRERPHLPGLSVAGRVPRQPLAAGCERERVMLPLLGEGLLHYRQGPAQSFT